MWLERLNTILHIASGAPVPAVLSDEYDLRLFYYYNKILTDNTTFEIPVERNSNEDKGVALLRFKNHLIYKFGYPNAEVLQSHAYYNLGLESCNIYEVMESDWLLQIEDMNRVHPFHNPFKFKLYKHFVITFEDSTFECIAKQIELNFFKKITMQDALKSACGSFNP